MIVAIGSDHAGFTYKTYLVGQLKKWGYSVMDLGTWSESSMDYPDVAHPVANAVEKADAALGILICGSGNGVCITANKHENIRAALCWNPELGALARQHNDANILCLPSRFVSKQMAKKIVDSFLHHTFEGGRHANRVQKIKCG
ncbi:MAG: ribose 5-phosphate isomerase B [Saprospiraceae bacterium]|jgi:ribose 5-phosphate isomerase B|nr:ribose 5-phosphate isomerase B [Saprospiraceae bacterium]